VKKSKYDKNDIAKFLSEKYCEEIVLIPMVEGQESQVFSFQYKNRDYVVRINPIIEGFKKDDYAYRNFLSSAIPIPKVIEYGTFDDNHSFCISEKAFGITFEDSSEITVNSLLSDITNVWTSIREIDISNFTGYGKFSSKDGNAPFRSWRDCLSSVLDKQKYDWKKVQSMEFVDSKLVDDLKSIFMELIQYCPEDRKLRHGDFGSNNVLVDSDVPKITAIIDWDNASYGDPYYDIAGAYFWSTWLMCMEKTSNYWDETLSKVPNYHERILCYQLHIGLEEIYENALDGDIDTLAWCQERCRQILENKKIGFAAGHCPHKEDGDITTRAPSCFPV